MNDTRTTTPTAARERGPAVVVGAIVGLAAVVCLMLLAFVTPTINSGPDDLPIAVSGPREATSQLTATVEKQSPGAFDITTFSTPEEAKQAVLDREAVGGIALSADGVTIMTASAAGSPYAALLKTLGAGLQASGQEVTYVEVAPLSEKDPTGAGLGVLALPLVFGGMISAVVLTVVARHSSTLRAAGSIAFSALAGLAVTAILQFWLGTIDGSYWLTSAAVALGIAAISLVILGLESLLGYAGIGLGALVMLLVANPLSGMATGAAWLPHPWGALGQLLPVGAAGTAIRSAAFFDGAGAGAAFLVLAAWVLFGLLLLAISARKHPADSGGMPVEQVTAEA